MRLRRIRSSPYLFEKLPVCQDLASMFHEVGKKLVLVRRQMDLLTGGEDAPAIEIDLEITNLEYGLHTFFLRARRVTEGDADARHELAGAERFGEVVVGPNVERANLVFFLSTRADDDDRLGREIAEITSYLHSVDIRKSEIEQDEVRIMGAR